MEKPSYFSSLTSQIVLMLTVSVCIMGLWNFFKTGEVIDIFNTLVSAFVGAYLQKSFSSGKQPGGETNTTTITASTTTPPESIPAIISKETELPREDILTI